MPGLILAAISPDNTPHGYNWTFAFPMLLFIVIALILYALFSRPHRRVPGRFDLCCARELAAAGCADRAGGRSGRRTQPGAWRWQHRVPSRANGRARRGQRCR